MKAPFTLCLMLLGFNVMATELGTWGDLWPIAEPDMLNVIENRLQELKMSGEMDKKMEEFRKRVVINSQRPEPVKGFKRAVRYERHWFDPSVRVAKDISDNNGNVFAKAGQVFNPLSLIAFSETLLFIDGDDPEQVAWVKRQKPETLVTRIILLRGNIPETSEKLDSRVYFDQYGTLTTKFGLIYVPARITSAPSGLRLQVEFIPPEMTQYDNVGNK